MEQYFQVSKAIGGIVKKLGDVGMLEESVFFYATDNGGLIGAGGSNLPFRYVQGHVTSPFEISTLIKI